MTYTVETAQFWTPRNRSAVMAYRTNSSDWNTVYACMTEDEYRLKDRHLTGTAVDIGAHIGGVTVGLALDNPELHVIAVEPVPDNAALLRRNVEQNGVADRVTVIEGAAGGKRPVSVWYGYTGSESAEHHAFIGNSSLAYDTSGTVTHETVRYAKPVRLADLGDVALVKIDCEGGEYAVLADEAVAKIPVILGEWHPVRGKTQFNITGLLGDTHDVTFSGPEAGPGGFVAVAR
jgi:FkbM family methyltransferase